MSKYECPVCGSDFDEEYLDMCESEVNRIKAQEEAKKALQHILEMQTRGFIVLGEKASAMALNALRKLEKEE